MLLLCFLLLHSNNVAVFMVPNANSFSNEIKKDYAEIKTKHENKKQSKKLISIENAREKKIEINWTDNNISKPKFTGIKVFNNIDLNILKDFIDWTPFFTSWQLRGKFPQILKDTVVGKEATDLYNDALKMLEDIIDGDWLRSKGVIGIFPANSNEDDIEIYNDENRSSANVILHQLRQQLKKAEGKSNYCLADFIAPKNSNIKDHIGAFAVTTGLGIEQKLAEFEKDNDDYQSILLKALADRLAEAAAEYLHRKIRKDIWGYSSNESLDNDELINEKYIGIRPAPGYPSCPDHTEKLTIFNDLLNVEKHTGITLTESMAMYPASSVCGLYFAHPESRYFGLGLIKKDQVSDYAKRKNKSVDEINKWLSPNLSTE
ncbi:MAG TPA: hypothetical protein EYQ86_05260 [Bacteroidetes bacterium]|nr:hypothetical protein [Bacteroidota bacterium]